MANDTHTQRVCRVQCKMSTLNWMPYAKTLKWNIEFLMNLCAIWCFAHNAQKLTTDYMCMQSEQVRVCVWVVFCRINYSKLSPYRSVFEDDFLLVVFSNRQLSTNLAVAIIVSSSTTSLSSQSLTQIMGWHFPSVNYIIKFMTRMIISIRWCWCQR